MKTNFFSLLLFVFAGTATLFFQSCSDKCEDTYTYTAYEPIYMQYSDFRLPVTAESPRELKNPGKIYVKTPYLFVNEINEGIHIFNNSDPANPQNISFIPIPGNVDMAVKGNVLYADNYTDLLSLDISNPENVTLLNREEVVFLSNYESGGDLGLIVGYTPVLRTEKYDCSNYGGNGGVVFANEDVQTVGGGAAMDNASNGTSSLSSAAANGVGGSMARFTIPPFSNYLYTVTRSQLTAFDISNAADPQLINTQNIGWQIETIYPFNNYLMIGSETGLFIYNINNPATPTYAAEMSHVRACDPVVAAGNYAYVTLRTGTTCEGELNELRVIDISNINNLTLLKQYPLTNPHGLGIDNNILFVCDGTDGLKIYDATDPLKIDQKMLQHYDQIHAVDVIPLNNILLMVGDNGIYQYDYSNLNNVTLLSTIPIK